jgi:hypothetical protein
MAADNLILSPVEVNRRQTTNGGFASDLLDLYGEAMDQALGIEKTSLAAMVELNSCALDTCEHLAGDLFETVYSVFASCVQAQLSWLSFLTDGSKALVAVAVPVGMFAAAGEGSAQASAGLLDHTSMDVAMGEGSGDPLPGTVPSIAEAGAPGGQAQPAETPERGMAVAIGETAA